jgi:thiaminase/transcriptional activator TenA
VTDFADSLVRAAEPDWTNATTHRFTVELADDVLADEVWRNYLIQDYAFVETLTSLVGYAVGKAPTMVEKTTFAGFLSVLTGAEDAFFKRAFAAAGVAGADWAGAADSDVTAAFKDLFADAWKGSYADVLAVFLPVEWVYLTWATAQADKKPRAAYDEWIVLHNVPDFREFVMFMKGELNRVSATLNEVEKARVSELFSRACELEVAFFHSVYAQS